MLSSWQEEEILRDILDGLNATVANEELDHTKVDPIKFNKLLFLAVDYFDLPITYRWYKYGSDFTPHGRSIDEDLGPTALEKLASPEEPRIDEEDVGEEVTPPTPQQVCHFYREEVEDLERLFEDDTKEYLRTFYEDYAPPHLQDVYSACAVFQKSLDQVGYADSPGEVVTKDIDTIVEELNDLNHAVMFCEPIADADEPFKDYANLLKDVLVTVANSESTLSPRQEESLRSVVKFFYKRAWELVALKIASEDSRGSRNLNWEQSAGYRFSQEYNTYEGDLRALRQRSKRANLISENLLHLSGPKARQATTDGRAEREKEVFQEWDGVSEPPR
jgi:hypothetical protein